MNYELRLFDEILLKFGVTRGKFGEYVFTITEFDESKRSLLPIGFVEVDEESLNRFLRHRILPKNREYSHQILSRVGLHNIDYLNVIIKSKGLSLNDSYWITEEGFSGTFEEFNLFENNFSRVMSKIAMTGIGNISKKGFVSSPEFTTNGMLKKCWRRENGVYLFKGGTSGAENTGLEPYSEYYAAQIAGVLGINHIDYNIKKWNGTLCSTCKLFTSQDVSYVPIYRFVEKARLSNVCNFLQNLGPKYYEKFCDMQVFDALIINTDRHFGNFGLLVDSHTNEILDFAPIFDNGLSLLCYGTERDFKKINKYASIKSSPYLTYDDILTLFLTDKQKSKLRKMIGFKFKRHSRYNLPKARLKKLEDFIQRRIEYMLNFEGKN